MTDTQHTQNTDLSRLSPELRHRVEHVARRCRIVRALRCWVRFSVITLALICAVTALLAWFTPDGLGAMVLVTIFGVLEAVALWRVVLKPLRVPITVDQVALFIDEHHPELENRIISAIEFGAGVPKGSSPWIVQRFLEEAAPKVRQISFVDLLDARAPWRMSLAFCSALVLSACVIVLFSHLWIPSLSFVLPRNISKLAALPFTVEPGDALVRHGDNQMVWVRTEEANRKVVIRWRIGTDAWQSEVLEVSSSDQVFYHQFLNIQRIIEYDVQMGRRRSAAFRIRPWTPPEVESIDLVYTYPEYLGRDTREVPNSGNITAIEGTEVDVEVLVNKKLQRAEMVFDSGERLPLELRSDIVWATRLTVERDDSYHIELTDFEDNPSEFNPEYRIVARKDEPPEIRIEFPRGDIEVSMLEEVPFDFEVSDDFGFAEYGIEYEITGREPVRISLNSTGTTVTAAQGHHEILLEELDLEPGDFITWTVWAKDANPLRDRYEEMGDPYFLEIRPFARRYRESVSDSGGGQGGGSQGGEEISAQKDIIIATWNLRRESRYLTTREFDERRNTIVETQDGLRRKLSLAAGIMGQPRPEVLRLREAMSRSVDALERAQLPEPKGDLSEAASHQQKAYRLMLKLMPNDVEVRRNQGGGAGGGGGAESRPDIQELEMDRNRNFYEGENVTEQEHEATQEVLNKIKALAQRQQAINEEIAKLVSELELAKSQKEREELRRRLERLQEEQKQNLDRLDEVQQELASNRMNNQATQDARENLEQARRQMNRSLEQLENDQLQQARASGSRASQALGDVEEQLKQFSRGAAERRMQALIDQMNDLRQKQASIVEHTEALREEHESPSMDRHAEMDARREELQAQKTALSAEFVDTMNDASDLAERARQTQELMSRKLGDWLRETSKDGILEDIAESEPLVRYGVWDAALSEEQKIALKLDKAAAGLVEVARHLVGDDLEGMQKALEHLDNLMDTDPGQRAAGGKEGQEDRQPGAAEEGEEGLLMARGEDGEASGEPGKSQGQPSQDGAATSGGGDANVSPSSAIAGSGYGEWTEEAMRRFAREDYQTWLEELRSAESLLPPRSLQREQVTRLREQIETIRRVWRQRALAPQYELFLEVASQPLRAAAEALQSEIERQLNETEFILADEGDIPQRYKQQVSDYFRDLSEAQGSR